MDSFNDSSQEPSELNTDIDLKISSEQSNEDFTKESEPKEENIKSISEDSKEYSSDDTKTYTKDITFNKSQIKSTNDKVQKMQFKQSRLMTENQVLHNHIDQLVTSKSAAEFELKQLKLQDKEINESQENMIQNLSIENTQLKRKLDDAQETIESQAQEIAKLTKEQKEMQNATFNEIQSLKQENRKLTRKQKLQTQNAANKEENEIIKKLQEQNEKNLDKIVEFQKHLAALTTLLNLQNVKSEELWIKIMDEFALGRAAKERNAILEQENAKLKSDLKISLEELENIKKPTKTSSKQADELNSVLQKLLHEERKINKENCIQLNKLHEKVKFSNIFAQVLCNVYKQVNDLHAALQRDQNKNKFKSLIFTTICIRNLLSKNNSSIEETTVIHNTFDAFFKKNCDKNIDCKFKWLRMAYTRLTEDLVHSQADLQTSEEKRNHLKKKINQMKLEITQNTDNSSHYEKKYRAMRQKIDTLKAELNSMIQPSLYESTVKSLDQEIARSSELQGKCIKLEETLTERDNEIVILKREIDTLHVTINTVNANLENVKNQMKEDDAEKEILELLVKGKSKDILALERIVARQENYRASVTQHLNLVTRSLLPHIPSAVLGDKCIKIGKPTALAENINPAFIYN